jgi:hypothetical protein
MKTLKTTVVILAIKHEKDLPDLAQWVAARAWSIDGVRSVEEQGLTPIVPKYQAPAKAAGGGKPAAELELMIPRWLKTE